MKIWKWVFVLKNSWKGADWRTFSRYVYVLRISKSVTEIWNEKGRSRPLISPDAESQFNFDALCIFMHCMQCEYVLLRWFLYRNLLNFLSLLYFFIAVDEIDSTREHNVWFSSLHCTVILHCSLGPCPCLEWLCALLSCSWAAGTTPSWPLVSPWSSTSTSSTEGKCHFNL